MLADANKMQAEVMRMQAGQLKDNGRLKLLEVAGKLQEEIEKLKREGERLVAEAVRQRMIWQMHSIGRSPRHR